MSATHSSGKRCFTYCGDDKCDCGAADHMMDDGYEDDPGCCECDGGWRHGCMDDMCRGSADGIDCPDAYPCRHCNPKGLLGF